MRRGSLRVCLVLAVAVSIIYVLSTKSSVPTLEASRTSGFYDEPFYLELYAPAGEIYYTIRLMALIRTETRFGIQARFI